MKLESKVAIVTGSGSGIGRATALRLAKDGAAVVVCDLNQAGIDETVRLVGAQGRQAVGIACNVADRADAQDIVAAALDQFGRLDILINNAGITRDALTVRVKDGEVKFMSEEQWDAVLNVNLKGTWLMAQAAAVPMIKQKYGRVVNTASISAQGNVGQANYSASKAGVIGLTRTLALEWARFNINVNCVAPGGVHTPMTAAIPEQIRSTLVDRIPFKRWADPDEIAAVHAFLASDDASYITGQVIWADGGVTLGG
ncbi:MAG: beta-ketoacyl-ACP reductase [Chloroflexi bacterium]|nr:MAG: beta-ketoacyl-ACP reductase [Chloroflexota bacterium]